MSAATRDQTAPALQWVRWADEFLSLLEQERDEQPPDAAIAVEVRVNRFELDVQEPGAHERRVGVFGVHVLLEGGKHLGERVRWRGHIDRVARSRSADPVLAPSNLPGQLVRAAYPAHQALMSLVEEPYRERQPSRIAELAAGVGERLKVVADLLDVGVRGRAVVRFEREEVDQGRLGTFDLRGEYRLFAHERIDEPVE